MRSSAFLLWIGLALIMPVTDVAAQQASAGGPGQEVIVSQDLQAKIADRYETNAQTFHVFLNTLKKAIEKDDSKTVAGMVQYPIKAGVHGKSQRITSSKQLVTLYSKVFTKDYKDLVLKDFSDLTLMSKGIMLGDGSMWLNTDEKSVKWQVIAINNF